MKALSADLRSAYAKFLALTRLEPTAWYEFLKLQVLEAEVVPKKLGFQSDREVGFLVMPRKLQARNCYHFTSFFMFLGRFQSLAVPLDIYRSIPNHNLSLAARYICVRGVATGIP